MITRQKDWQVGVRRATGRTLAAAGMTAAATMPAHAQIAQVTTVMTNVQTVLTGRRGHDVHDLDHWAGFKMAFQHAKWSEISNIMIGGILVGGAAAIAAWLI